MSKCLIVCMLRARRCVPLKVMRSSSSYCEQCVVRLVWHLLVLSATILFGVVLFAGLSDNSRVSPSTCAWVTPLAAALFWLILVVCECTYHAKRTPRQVRSTSLPADPTETSCHSTSYSSSHSSSSANVSEDRV